MKCKYWMGVKIWGVYRARTQISGPVVRLSPELWFSETAQQREDRDNIGKGYFQNMINMQIKSESSNASPKEIEFK